MGRWRKHSVTSESCQTTLKMKSRRSLNKNIERKKAALFIYVTAADCGFCTVRCMPQDSAQPQVRNVCDTWRTKKHNACVRSPDSNINRLQRKNNKHDLGKYVDRLSLYYLQLHIVLHCLSFFFLHFLCLLYALDICRVFQQGPPLSFPFLSRHQANSRMLL